MHISRYVLALMAACLFVPSPAFAEDESWIVYPTATVPGWAVKMSLRIATRHWQVCQGAASVEWIYSTELLGEAGHAWPGNCRISINTGSYPVHWVGPFCDTVVHEYGHVAGYRDPLNVQDPAHSHQDGHLMSASGFYVRANKKWTGVHWMCRRVQRRAAREALGDRQPVKGSCGRGDRRRAVTGGARRQERCGADTA